MRNITIEDNGKLIPMNAICNIRRGKVAMLVRGANLEFGDVLLRKGIETAARAV